MKDFRPTQDAPPPSEAGRWILERKLAQLRLTAERYRRQAVVVGPVLAKSFERRAAELELTAMALQNRFGDQVGPSVEAAAIITAA